MVVKVINTEKSVQTEKFYLLFQQHFWFRFNIHYSFYNNAVSINDPFFYHTSNLTICDPVGLIIKLKLCSFLIDEVKSEETTVEFVIRRVLPPPFISSYKNSLKSVGKY
jgi:hypothetical protein